MTETIKRQLLTATMAQFKADHDAALATLSLYFNKSVAVGDHPNILEKIRTLTDNLATAEETITVLQKHFESE